MAKQKFIKTFLCLAAIILLNGAVVVSAKTAAKARPYKYTRIFYYQDSASARRSLFGHPGSIDIVAPQSYALNSAGKLIGKTNAAVLAFARKHKIKVMPLVTNGKFSQEVYQAILNDPAIQDLAIASLIGEAKKNSYWGWQIDFEQMDASYSDKYLAFVQRAAGEMKKNDLALSVAVIAKVSDNPNDYPNDLWQKTIGVYDYSSLATSTDFISLMSYDDPNSKGPIVEYPWLKQVLDYSTKLIPRNKLSLGIPFYYWQWDNLTGKRIGIGGKNGISNILKKHKVAFHYSAKQEAPYLTYWSHAKQYTVWYENSRSIQKKIDLIKKNQLHGFSAWALGLELSSVYSVFK